MATRKANTIASSAAEAGAAHVPEGRADYSFAPPSASTFGVAKLRLPGDREAWTFMASPVALQCSRGIIVPRLSKAYFTPGVNGNGRERANGAGWVTTLQAEGYVPIPHTFPTTAFGEPMSARPSTYLREYHGEDVHGRECVYFCEVWRRPRPLGHLMVWDFDAAGWQKFLADVLAMVAPNGIEAVQVEIAVANLVREARDLLDREDRRGKRLLGQRLENLPLEHTPPDLLDARRALLPAPAADAAEAEA